MCWMYVIQDNDLESHVLFGSYICCEKCMCPLDAFVGSTGYWVDLICIPVFWKISWKLWHSTAIRCVLFLQPFSHGRAFGFSLTRTVQTLSWTLLQSTRTGEDIWRCCEKGRKKRLLPIFLDGGVSQIISTNPQEKVVHSLFNRMHLGGIYFWETHSII